MFANGVWVACVFLSVSLPILSIGLVLRRCSALRPVFSTTEDVAVEPEEDPNSLKGWQMVRQMFPCQAGATTRQLVRRRVIRGRYSPSDSCWLAVLNQVWEDISTLPVEEHSQTPLILRSTTDTSYLKDRFFVLVGTHSLGVYICVYYLYIFFALLHPFCLHCWFTLVYTPRQMDNL